ncbi:hypothetical protein BT69DRAFT_1238772 [Atractiella rhizophila]|nr:hypothetical protein BT69DRAFT_1238772 [Atractiella rhizophila]
MKASLGTLPPELLPQLVYHLASASPIGPPNVLSLILVNKKFYYALSFSNNPQVWASLFDMRFDGAAVRRRIGDWRGGLDEGGVSRKRRHGWKDIHMEEGEMERQRMVKEVGSKAVEKAEKSAMGSPMSVDLVLPPFEPVGKGKEKEIQLPSPVSLDVTPPFLHTLTARHVAHEFRARCVTLKRIKYRVKRGVLLSHPEHTVDDGEEEMLNMWDENEDGGFEEWGIQDHEKKFRLSALWMKAKEELNEDLWRIYFMLLEHDEKNLDHLIHYASFSHFLNIYFRQDLLAAALRPGYPKDTTERCLALWCSWLMGEGSEKIAEESAQESEERFFVLKPYVFAAHNFDAFHAAWTSKYLPAPQPVTQPPPSASSLHVSPTRPTRIERVSYFSLSLPCTPPLISLAATYSFFERVERDPALVRLAGLDPLSAMTLQQPQRPLAPGKVSGMLEGAGGSRANPLRPPIGTRTSALHDRDWARLVSCLDPQKSEGLPDLFFKGAFEGTWEGRFSFFDFDSYRDMLGGEMISLYEGPFGCQPQVWKLEEKLVKVTEEEMGGSGSALNAGYELGEKGRTSSEKFSAGDRRRVLADLGFVDDGPKAKRMKSAGSTSSSYRTAEDAESVTSETSKERYEILLSGTGHSAWGQFILRGRVRSWDGLLSLTKEYTPDGRGRWIYRGYIVSENTIVGRWRDTFTPEDLYGYEGTFLMQRRQI